jgi:hypothetical protein
VDKQLLVDQVTIKQNGPRDKGVYVGPSQLWYGHLTNLIVLGTGSFGIDSAIRPSYSDVNGFTTAYKQTACATGCRTTNPTNDGTPPSLLYPPRIEVGSALKEKGSGRADYGANVRFGYGNDGTFWGDAGFDTLTATLLWPWPNDARIKREMCTDSGVTRGFCSNSSLTEYIWTALGNPVPTPF